MSNGTCVYFQVYGYQVCVQCHGCVCCVVAPDNGTSDHAACVAMATDGGRVECHADQ